MLDHTIIVSEEKQTNDIINDLDLHIKIRVMPKQMVDVGLMEEADAS